MSFQEIIKAAKAQDVNALKQALINSSIDVTEPGSFDWLTPAAQLLIDNDKPAVNFLINNGTQVINIAIAAVWINDKNYLLMLTENYTFDIKEGTLFGSKMLEMGYIPFEMKDQLTSFVKSRQALVPSIPISINIGRSSLQFAIDHQTAKKAISIFSLMHRDNLSFTAAFTKTHPNFKGTLYLLMMVNSKNIKNNIHFINFDIWVHIFSFLIVPHDGKINTLRKDLEDLDFHTSRSYLSAQLKIYHSSDGPHKKRALSFFRAISTCRNNAKMQEEINQQAQLLQGHNSYLKHNKAHKINPKKSKLDKFYDIVGLWEEMRTGKSVVFTV